MTHGVLALKLKSIAVHIFNSDVLKLREFCVVQSIKASQWFYWKWLSSHLPCGSCLYPLKPDFLDICLATQRAENKSAMRSNKQHPHFGTYCCAHIFYHILTALNSLWTVLHDISIRSFILHNLTILSLLGLSLKIHLNKHSSVVVGVIHRIRFNLHYRSNFDKASS